MRYGMIDKPACEFHVFFGRQALRPLLRGRDVHANLRQPLSAAGASDESPTARQFLGPYCPQIVWITLWMTVWYGRGS